MNKQKFNNVVLNPENISSEDKVSLKNLAKNYPYSQIIHSLLAKAYAPENSAEYKKLVGTAAMYATDRQILKDLVTQVKVQEKAPVRVQEKVIADSQPIEKEKVVELKKSKVDIDTSSFFEDSEMLRNAIWSDLESLRLSKEHYLDSLEHSIEVEKELKEKHPKKATASKVKTSSKPASTTKKVASTKETKKASSKKTDEVKATPKKTAKTKTTPAKAKAKTTKAKSTAGSKTIAKKSTTTSSKSKAESKTPKSTKTEKQATTKDNEISEQRIEIKATLKEQINIIDSFIKKEPSISSRPVKNIESDQKDLSEKSTNFGDDLISENLAQILVEQGKSQKAIDMYKKLIWKFPQKKAYFAARIEDLNK